MSTDVYVYGIRPADKKYKQMKVIWDACRVADIDPPKEVGEFFDWCKPNDKGVVINIKDATEKTTDCYGYDIHIDKLPKDVKIIRCYLG